MTYVYNDDKCDLPLYIRCCEVGRIIAHVHATLRARQALNIGAPEKMR